QLERAITWWPSVALGIASGTTGRVGEASPLHVLLAGRAVVAIDRVLGHLRRDLLGDVLDDPRAFAVAALQGAATAGAYFQAVLDAGVDAAGSFSPGPRVPQFRPR